MNKSRKLARRLSMRWHQHCMKKHHHYRWRTHTSLSCRMGLKKEHTWHLIWVERTSALSISSSPEVRFWKKTSSSTTSLMKHVSLVACSCLITSLNASKILWSWRTCQLTWESRWASHSLFLWNNTHSTLLSSLRGRNLLTVHLSSGVMWFSCSKRHLWNMEWRTLRCFAFWMTQLAHW